MLGVILFAWRLCISEGAPRLPARLKSFMKPRIVTTTSVFEPGYPAKSAMHRLKRLGFEAQDMALDFWENATNSPFMGNEYLQWAIELRKSAEESGIPYTHCHSPAEAGDHIIIERALETASALGVRFMVLHPVCGNGAAYFDEAEEIGRAHV